MTTHLEVRLVRKLAERLEGVDLSRHRVGEVLELPTAEAIILLAHGWAVRPHVPPGEQTPKRSPKGHKPSLK